MFRDRKKDEEEEEKADKFNCGHTVSSVTDEQNDLRCQVR